MKLRLVLLLGLVLGLASAAATASLLSAAHRRNASAPSGAAFSDDFNRADAGTLGANWTAVTNTTGIVSNQASVTGAAGYNRQVYTATDTDTVDQYVKVTFVSNVASDYFEVMLRVNGAGTTFYTVYWNVGANQLVWWSTADGFLESLTMSAANGDSFGFQIVGTGNSTTIGVWKNPAANTPTNSTTWGGAAADVTFTANPTTAINTGNRVGLGGYKITTMIYDNMFGGDVP